jgi:hypothetical protein
MAAFLFLATKRVARESHRQLSLLTLSQSSDGKAITTQLEKWEDDA